MNIIEHLSHSTFEYLNDILHKATRSNPAYAAAVSEEGELYTIELENTPGVKPYVQAQRHAEWMEHEILYYQGYCDCIRLLQFLNVLPSNNQTSVFDVSSSIEGKRL